MAANFVGSELSAGGIVGAEAALCRRISKAGRRLTGMHH
jgi:hypothetical protein